MTKTYPLLRCAGVSFALASTLLSMNTYADVYRCFNSTGHLVTSDRPLPECQDKATEVYRNDGVFKQRLSGAMTPEQRRDAKLQEQQQTEAAQQQEEERKEKLFLTTHYPNERAIEISRQRALNVIDDKILEEKNVIKIATEALERNQNELKRTSKDNINGLIGVRNKTDELNQTIEHSTRLIQRYNLEKEKINQQYDQVNKRYTEVVLSETR